VHSDWDKPFLIKFLLWRPLEFDAVFIGWLVNLRNGAWIHASQLASAASEHDRSILDKKLHQAVQQTLDHALKQSWPWSRIFGLSSPGAVAIWAGAAAVSIPLGLLQNYPSD
jgi:hypothetical protein